MLRVQPSAGLSSIMTSKSLSSGKSLHTIVNDLKKMSEQSTGKKMTFGEIKKVAKTIHKMNTNPNAVVTNATTKSVIGTLAQAGHVKSKYETNVGSAIAMMRKIHTKELNSSKPFVEKKISEMTPVEKRKKALLDKRKKSRLKEIAVERRVEAEAEHEKQVEAQVYSLDAQRRKAKVSVRDSETQSKSSVVSAIPASATNDVDEPQDMAIG